MKIREILVESKKKHGVMKAPRAKHLHDILMSKKGGGHFSEKSDYKRAKEKEKFRKEMRDE